MNEILRQYLDRCKEWLENLHFKALHIKALLGLFALVLLVSIAIAIRGGAESVEVTAPTPPIAIVIALPEVMVDVAGGVKSPGVYSLPANSRVIDALKAAGKAKVGTDLSLLNLARIVKDGEQIYVEPPLVPSRVSNSQSGSSHSSHSQPPTFAAKKSRVKMEILNINRATASEFDQLPGIGPVLAKRIFSYRKINGPFSVIEDLQKVSGIGSSKFTKLKSKVRV